MGISSADIRTLNLVGHGDSAKTSLAEAMLFVSGAIPRQGKVTEGSTVLDWDDDEKAASHSLDGKVARVEWKGKRIYLVDTPGYSDFIAASLGSFPAVESSLVCVNASKGVSVNTRRMWDAATMSGKARAVVVTRIDAENLDIPQLLAELKDTFGTGVLPVNLPCRTGPDVKTILTVLGSGDVEAVVDVPAARQALLEKIVEEDEELMIRYLDGETPSEEELAAALRAAIRTGHIVPVLFTSPEKGIGVTEILDFVVDEMPAAHGAVRHPLRSESGEEEVTRSADDGFCAVVWKTAIDPFVGKLSYLRILSGIYEDGMDALNVRTGKHEKLAHAAFSQGKEHLATKAAVAGDIITVSKIETLTVGDTLCDPASVCLYPPVDWPAAMVSLAIEARSSNDETKLGPALHKLMEEDPTFHVEVHRETHERIASGMSSLHLNLVLSRLKRRFHLEVDTRTPRIPYRETINGKADGHHRHKKQSGGRGQFAEVYLRVWGKPRGEGFEFVDSVVGGSVPRNFIPAVEKGVRESMAKGPLAGYPVVDVAVELYDGKEHPVDSSEAAFRMAGGRGMRDGFLKAKPVLLEPVMRLEILVPTRFMGDITGDLNKRRGRIQGMDARGTLQVISAMVPLAEIATYSTELRSITGGEGSFAMEEDHYDVVPGSIAEAIIAKAKKADQS